MTKKVSEDAAREREGGRRRKGARKGARKGTRKGTRRQSCWFVFYFLSPLTHFGI